MNLVRGEGQRLTGPHDPRLRAAILSREHREVGVEEVERHDAEQQYQDDREDYPSGATVHALDTSFTYAVEGGGSR